MPGSRARLSENGRRAPARPREAGHESHCQGGLHPVWPGRKKRSAPGVLRSMSDAGPVTIYTANGGRGGILRTAARSLGDIMRYRYLVWTLFSRDFKAQFKQSFLGYFWAAL